MMDPMAKIATTAGVITATATAVQPLSQDFAILLIPYVQPLFFGAVGAFAVLAFVRSEPPESPFRAIMSMVASTLVAGVTAKWLPSIGSFPELSVQTFGAILLGIVAPILVRTLHANFGRWFTTAGNRLSSGETQRSNQHHSSHRGDWAQDRESVQPREYRENHHD
jgi:hypothetical protein